ncbi:MAG: GNAT family N-acetyltransferase [Bacteroidales bacterium]|nr:GNAT family N-acetyltransferase [Bacteroidales bacterium]
MKERLLLYLKRHVPFIWKLIEGINNLLTGLLYRNRLKRIRNKYAEVQDFEGLKIKLLRLSDIQLLGNMLNNLQPADYTYFRPHGFDEKSLKKVVDRNLYLPFGVVEENRLIGYAFLRLFFTGTVFFGRMVSPEYQGKGIGHRLAAFIQQVAAELDFKAFSTIHVDNVKSLSTHEHNQNIEIVKKLANGYIMIKFVLPKKGIENG